MLLCTVLVQQQHDGQGRDTGQAGGSLLLLYNLQGCHCHRPADVPKLFRLFWVDREAACVLVSRRRTRSACVVRVWNGTCVMNALAFKQAGCCWAIP
jgi:hypothetical protein